MERNIKSKEKSRSTKRIIILVVVIIYVILSPIIALYFLQTGLKTDTPLVVVVSDSMNPSINRGDLLFIQGSDAEDILNGSVIFFKAQWFGGPTEYIIHRVIDKQEIADVWYFTTKGDANTYQDPTLVSENDVFGIMVGGIPYIGYLKIVLLDSWLIIPIIIFIIVIIIISMVVNSNKKNRQKTLITNSKENKYDTISSHTSPSRYTKPSRYTSPSKSPPGDFSQPAVRAYVPLQNYSPDITPPPQIHSQPQMRIPHPAPYKNTQQAERTLSFQKAYKTTRKSTPTSNYSQPNLNHPKQQNYRINHQPTQRRPTPTPNYSDYLYKSRGKYAKKIKNFK